MQPANHNSRSFFEQRRAFMRCGAMGCAVIGSSLLAGCAHWSRETTGEAKSLVAQPKMSPDSVVVESIIIRFPEEQSEALDTLWKTVDESIFDVVLRRKLSDNGMRAGLIIGDIPVGVRKRLQELGDSAKTDPLEQANLAADVQSSLNRMQCRAGRRKELVVRRELSRPLVVLTSQEGRVEGASYDQPSMLFDMRSIPHGDGRATLQLTPEIQHGEERKAYVRSDFGLRHEMNRDRKVWEQLAMSVKLSPGQILAMSCNGEPKSSNLGKAFFVTHTAEQAEERVLLLVRLATTQLDELFAPEGIEAAEIVAER